jgi:hypothetical protein
MGSLVRSDYLQTASIVYETTAADLILQNRFLSVLSHAKDLQIQVTAGLPSWAADCSRDNGCAPLVYFGIGTDRLFDASAARKSKRFPRSIQNSRLSLLGALFDEATHALATPMSDIVGKRVDLEESLAFGGLLPLQYFNGQDLIDVLWRTITFDSILSDGDRTPYSPAPQTYRQASQLGGYVNASIGLASIGIRKVFGLPRPQSTFCVTYLTPRQQSHSQ